MEPPSSLAVFWLSNSCAFLDWATVSSVGLWNTHATHAHTAFSVPGSPFASLPSPRPARANFLAAANSYKERNGEGKGVGRVWDRCNSPWVGWAVAHLGRKGPSYPFSNLKLPPQMVSPGSFRSQNKLADSCWRSLHVPRPLWGGSHRPAGHGSPLTFTKPQFLKAWLRSPRSPAFYLTLEATSFRSREHFEMKRKVSRWSKPDPRPALGPRQPLRVFKLSPARQTVSAWREFRGNWQLQLGSL